MKLDMCGIVGSISLKGESSIITSKFIETMRDAMVHRGPDGAGTWINKGKTAGFGHRRLSIVDLSNKATQPMVNDDESIVLTFNGEIYNHVEIREELKALGVSNWKTDHSDTEVLLKSYEQWGMECLHKLRGMFAFSVWDENKKEMYLARDRMGIKPLYYSLHGKKFTFASEIKAILTDETHPRSVNEEAFFHYLSFLTTPAPMTLFKGISKLPNATWMKIDEQGNIEKYRYWDALQDAAKPPKSEEEAEKSLIDNLREAVNYRKVADVPVGCFLSGGIDSSTITALFSEGKEGQIQEPVKTFTIGAKGDYSSYEHEMDYAQEMADFSGTDHKEHHLTQKDMLDFLPDLIRLQDEPIADPSCVPVYYLAKMARESGVVVVQGGEGADEIYCGYPGWMMAYKLEKLSSLPVPKFIKKLGLKFIEATGKDFKFRHEYLRRSAEGQPVFWGGAEAFSHAEKMKLVSDEVKEAMNGNTSWEAIKPIWNNYQEAREEQKSTLNWMSYLDLNFRLPELLLMRIDKMTMATSIEARVPFLDHKFVEASMAIPEEIRIKGNVLKYLLKKAVRGLIPDSLIDRKKQGLQMPLNDWFFGEYGDKTKQEVLDFCDATNLLNRQGVEDFLQQNRGAQAWYLLNVALWWKEYIKPYSEVKN